MSYTEHTHRAALRTEALAMAITAQVQAMLATSVAAGRDKGQMETVALLLESLTEAATATITAAERAIEPEQA
jgi:hypothetical protein